MMGAAFGPTAHQSSRDGWSCGMLAALHSLLGWRGGLEAPQRPVALGRLGGQTCPWGVSLLGRGRRGTTNTLPALAVELLFRPERKNQTRSRQSGQGSRDRGGR